MRHAQHPVLGETLFRDALLREGRRADRFEESFVLLRISLAGGQPLEARWSRIIDTLALTARDTDIVGWFEHGASLGLIRPHVGAADARDTAAGLGIAAQHELANSLAPDAAASCSIQVDVFSPHPHAPRGAFGAATGRDAAEGARLRHRVKRMLDVVGGAALLVALSPVLLITAAVVKVTSAGPVLFRQERIGRHGVPFTMLKFRTMTADADPSIHQQFVATFIRAASAPEPPSAGVPVFKLVNDPRVTKVGQFLRRSSLDELPQLWNVLKGEMSLVGPRPPLPYEVEGYKRWHWQRVLDATPGITGPWQVTGRSRTSFDDMVRIDIRYARSHSVWTDLKILLSTPRAVASRKGAH